MLQKREYTGHMMSKENGSLCMVGFSVDFIPTTLNDQEVYEVKKENDHYCYMTPAMVDKIFELIPGNKNNRYVDQFSFDLDNKTSNFVKLKNKLLLDLPDKIDEKSFLPGGLPFQSASLTLYSKSYQEKLVPAVTIKPHSSFTFDTNESTVIFKFPNNEIECTNFMVGEFAEGSHNTIDLNVENSKAEEIIIQGVRPISSINNETYLWIKNKEREVIYVYGVLLPSNVEKKEALFNEGVSYIPISANGAIRIYHAKIEADLNTITRCGIYSGGGIEVQDGDLAFGRGTSVLQVGEGLSVENMKLKISGDNNIERSLSLETDSSCIKNSVLNKASISFTEKQGPIDIVNTIFEGENSIEGISSIVDSSIENSTIVGNGDKIEAFMLRNIKNFSKALEEKKLAENKDQNNKITTKWEPL